MCECHLVWPPYRRRVKEQHRLERIGVQQHRLKCIGVQDVHVCHHESFCSNQYARLRMVQDVRDLRVLVLEVYRDLNSTDSHKRKASDEEGDGIGEREANAITFGHVTGKKSLCGLSDLVVEFTVGDP